MFVPLKGVPRPAGLERLADLLPPDKAETCSMTPIGVCLGEPKPAAAVVVVRMREGGRSAWSRYVLCETCARAGGDHEVIERLIVTGRRRAPEPTAEVEEPPNIWEGELASAE